MTAAKRPYIRKKGTAVAKGNEQDNTPAMPIVPGAGEIITRMGMIVTNNRDSAWLSASDKQQTTDDCFLHIVHSLEECHEIAFHITGTDLRMNRHDTPVVGLPAQTFINHLADREIYDFSITQGIPRSTFDELLEILNATADELQLVGGFAEFVKSSALTHIGARTVVYKEITEDELVITKHDMDKAGVDRDAISRLTNAVALLQGAPALSQADTEDAVSGLKAAAEDPVKLAVLILRASEVRSGSADVDGGETLGDIVVACMRLAYDELSKSPQMKTQKGKKALAKILVMLEHEILEGLRDSAGDDEAEKYIAGISDAAEAMRDELQIDALSDQYLKKQTAIEKSEESLLRYLRQKGSRSDEASQLGEKMMTEGLSMGNWQRLLVQSAASEPGGSAAGHAEAPGIGESVAAIQQLAVLLDHMQKLVSPGEKTNAGTENPDEDELRKTMQEVDRNVDKVIEGTNQKIGTLVAELTEDASISKPIGKDGKAIRPRMSRAKLLETLAEIVQEICQPLSVIHCSVSMMMSGSLGSINEAQSDILMMADQSSDKIRKLAKSMMRIAGVPSTLTPDHEMLGNLMADEGD
jgi:hypothetical protein